MRRVLLAAALVLAGSCGGSPTAPALSTTVPSVRPVVLAGGAYTLAVTLSTTGMPVCQNGFCTSSSLCINNPASASASFNVDLERVGDAATVRVPGSASSLVLSLQVAQSSVDGTIAGSARDANGVMVEVSGSVTGSAPANAAIAVSGNINGQFSVAGGGCSNNGHAWSLTPR
jgi:hypothetical protein